MKIIRPVEVPPKPLTATDAVMTASNVAVDDAPEYASGTSYSTGDKVMVLGTVQRVYEALQASTGSYPPDNSADWVDLGAVNRWKMFDGGTNTQTSNSETINVTINPSEIINSFSLFSIQAASLSITITGVNEGVVFDKTYSLIDNSAVDSWYAYYFEPINTVSELTGIVNFADMDLPSYSNATIDVVLDNGTGEAKCGLLVVGNSYEVGTTVYGTAVGIRDFSRKEVDDFGNFTVVSRRFFRTVDYDVKIPTGKVQFVQKLLNQRRASPTVYIGNEDNPETIVYGYYRDFDIVLSNLAFSSATLQVEGL